MKLTASSCTTAIRCDVEPTWTPLPSATSDAPLLFLFSVNTVAFFFISKSPLLFHTQIPAEVISSESVAPKQKLNIPAFIRNGLKHCRGSRSQWWARLVLEDIRHVLFPVQGIENPCCVLFNPSAPAVSKVHRGRIYSGAAEQPEQLPSLQYTKRVAFVCVAVNPEMSPRIAAFRLNTFHTGGVESPV